MFGPDYVLELCKRELSVFRSAVVSGFGPDLACRGGQADIATLESSHPLGDSGSCTKKRSFNIKIFCTYILVSKLRTVELTFVEGDTRLSGSG